MSEPTIRIEIAGQDEFMREVWNTVAEGNKSVGALLLEAATVTHREAVNSIRTGARSGKIYARGSKFHQASKEGEAPKSDTGVLLQNLTLEKEGNGYTVGSRKGAPHGFWLEFGTSMMGARPWLEPAFRRMTEKFLGKYRG